MWKASSSEKNEPTDFLREWSRAKGIVPEVEEKLRRNKFTTKKELAELTKVFEKPAELVEEFGISKLEAARLLKELVVLNATDSPKANSEPANSDAAVAGLSRELRALFDLIRQPNHRECWDPEAINSALGSIGILSPTEVQTIRNREICQHLKDRQLKFFEIMRGKPAGTVETVAHYCIQSNTLPAGGLFILEKLNKEQKKSTKFNQDGPKDAYSRASAELHTQRQSAATFRMEDFRVPRKEVTISDEILGQGKFSVVLKGGFRGEDVAVKRPKDNPDKMVYQANYLLFTRESIIIGSVCHENIIRLIGVCMDDPWLMILELMPDGSLDRRVFREELSESYIVSACVQVAKAVDYLHAEKIIHQDIAARNALCSADLVKLGDFGLAKDISSLNGYVWPNDRPFPLPLPPEILRSNMSQPFNEKTDVWYFGVLVWQVFFTHGTGLSPEKLMTETNLMRLGRERIPPTTAPESVKELLSLCWREDPLDRPSVREIVAKLQKYVSLKPCEHYHQ